MGGVGHKGKIGVINCYCTLEAERQDQREGALWHVMTRCLVKFTFRTHVQT